MKYRKKSDGQLLEVGDGILVSHCFGKRVDKVTRVTKTMAICEVPGSLPIRYPLKCGFGFCPKGGRSWTVSYDPIEIIKEGEE